MSSIDAVLVLTAPSAEASETHAQTAQNCQRIRQARALNIDGIFARGRQTVLYRLEGRAEDIDRFLAMLSLAADESLPTPIVRWTIPRRLRLCRHLREAVLIGDEWAWIRRQLDASRIDTELIRLFTLWLDLRAAETELGLVLDFTAASLDRFPGASGD